MRHDFMLALSFSLSSPLMFWIALVVLLAIGIIARRRRIAVSRLSLVLALLAGASMTLAAGQLTWQRPATTDLVVMVDLSPSTRGAAYRNRAALEARIKQLIDPAVHYQLLYFAASTTTSPPGNSADPFPDLPGDRTLYAPPGAPAVLLFSDARFALPSVAPPTLIVADPNLDRPTDASVIAIRAELNRGAANPSLSATVRVLAPPTPNPPPRRLTLIPAATQPSIALQPSADAITLSRPLQPGATLATAAFEAGPAEPSRDLWPENDALTLPLLPPSQTERWFVSTSSAAPSPAWRLITPDALPPAGSSKYLAASLILLDNLPAASIPTDRQRGLEQYVRDLGSALIIAGGDRAFSAGLYPGTTLESLSPLASSPPQPTTHWLLLADASGSMSQPIAPGASQTRWQRASRALLDLLPTLPPEDPVSVGSFSAELTWWTTPSRRPARDLVSMMGSLPPRSVLPGGPTNLAAALDRIATEAAGDTPTELLVLSDADVQMDDPPALANRLLAKKIRLHLLALTDPAVTDAKGLAALRIITTSTGGTLLTESSNPAQWSAQVRQLLSAAFPNRLIAQPTRVAFLADLAALPGREVSPWNRTWLKPSATLLAQAPSAGSSAPLAARHSVGAGEVVSLGFSPNQIELETVAQRSARPPRDPRFNVTWLAGSKVRVRINVSATGSTPAIDPNALQFTLSLASPDSAAFPQALSIPQTAPGRYELSIDAPRRPTFAAVKLGNQMIDQIALPGRYAPEFDEIGNDYEAMTRLARQTGGQVVTAVQTKLLELPTPRQPLSLTPHLALSAALLLTLSLLRWRWT